MGIDKAFGLPSDDIVPLFAAIDETSTELHVLRHENHVIGMAEGYASATGRLGVALVGYGPGLTNGFTGAVHAAKNESPVLIITGEQELRLQKVNAYGPDYKFVEMQKLLTSIGIQTFKPNRAESARETLKDAVNEAMKGRAVAFLLPMDILTHEIEYVDNTVAPAKKQRLEPSEAAIQSVLAVLQNSRKPLILGGYGAHKSGAKEALEELAEKIGALLLTTLKAKDMFKGHPYNLDLLGGFSHRLTREIVKEADCIIAFGASLNFYTTYRGEVIPAGPLIQVDIDRSHIGRWFDADVEVVSDAKLFAESLIKRLPVRSKEQKPFYTEKTLKKIDNFKRKNDFEPVESDRIDPRSLYLLLSELLPSDTNFVSDVGYFCAHQPYLSTNGPAHYKLIVESNAIGLGIGTAMGYAVAHLQRTTVLIVGDGGFYMQLSELETLVREQIPLLIIVMNDAAYGAEYHTLKRHGLPGETSVFPELDFVKVAKGFGVEAYRIETLEDFKARAKDLQNIRGPVLLDCKINGYIGAKIMKGGIRPEPFE